MKTFFLPTMIVAFLMLSAYSAQAQTNLNQTELMKQIIGSWKGDLGKDTSALWEVKSVGTGLESDYKVVTKGKMVTETKQLYGYDKKIDKYLGANLVNGMDIEIWAGWFTANNKFVFIPYSDIANPQKASIKIEGEFKSPDVYKETYINNGKPIRTDTYTRTK